MGGRQSLPSYGVDAEHLDWLERTCRKEGGQDLSSPLICYENNATLDQHEDSTAIRTMHYLLIWSYAVVKRNIKNLCAPGKSEEEQERIFNIMWPAFHWWYNSQHGRQRVDNLLNSIDFDLPREAITTLKLNWMEKNQRKYCLMHGVRRGLGKIIYRTGTAPGFWTTAEWNHADFTGEVKQTIQENNSFIETTTPIVNEELSRWRTFRWERWIQNGIDQGRVMVDPGHWGNPFWDRDQRREAEKKVLPEGFNDLWNEIYVSTGKIDANCTYDSCWEPKYEAGIKGNFYDHPDYGGMEPSVVVPANPFNFPDAHRIQSGGAGHSWKNPCDARAPLEQFLPIIAGVVGAAVPLFFLPREYKSTWILSASLGGTLYYVAQDMYGLDALLNIGKGGEHADQAATILTLGVGSGAVLFLHESGLMSSAGLNLSPSSGYAVAAVAGLGAYLLTKDKVKLSLDVSGGITTILTAPISLIETGIKFAANGCLEQLFTADFACTCAEADRTGGKEVIIEQMLGPVLGTTGKQYELRKACLQKEFKRGGWASTGDDDNVVSKCTGVRMENPFACFTAQQWIYRDPFYPDYKRTDEQEKDMWNQVWHCIDRNNPSFYPPQTEADVACEEAHGKQFRWDPKAGSCKNYALPGPNNTDPIGLQDPGAYTGGDEGCIIL